MILVEVYPVMMLTTSITATTGVLPVLSDTTMTMADMATQLSGFPLVMARHFSCNLGIVKTSKMLFRLLHQDFLTFGMKHKYQQVILKTKEIEDQLAERLFDWLRFRTVQIVRVWSFGFCF